MAQLRAGGSSRSQKKSLTEFNSALLTKNGANHLQVLTASGAANSLEEVRQVIEARGTNCNP